MSELESTALVLLSSLLLAVVAIASAEELYAFFRYIFGKRSTSKKSRQGKKLKTGFMVFRKGGKETGYICTQCGLQAKPITKGSIFIEIILWLCFLVPGLIYSIWRHSSRSKGCPDCRTQSMVIKDGPIGKLIINGKKTKTQSIS